jgi:hypothetical protein
MRFLMLSLVSLACLAGCAANPPPIAQTAPAAPPTAARAVVAQPAPAVQTASADGDQRICKSMPVTGSLTAKRVCSTRAEWDAFDKKARKALTSSTSSANRAASSAVKTQADA